jgi:[methyl-Co(III) methanol-specific corrinoid protein]:coenzyme M methyltransferase
MNIYTPKEEVNRILSGKIINYFPRFIALFTPVVDMMKKTNSFFPEANYEAEPMSKLALAAHEMANWRATMIPWASTVEMEALGCKVINNKNDIAAYPQFKEKAFNNIGEVKFDKDILKKGSLPAVFEATKIVRETIENKYNGDIPIFSMTQGPFTIGVYSYGVNEMFKIMLKDPESAYKILDIISDLNIIYSNKMIESGGDFLQMSDPAAEGLSGEIFSNIVVPIYKKIAREVKVKKIVHICGRTSRILKYLPETGFDAFSFDHPKVEFEKIKEAFNNRMKIVGSVPTITHLLNGTYEDVLKESIDWIKRGTDIMAASCGLPQYTPLKNAKAMADAIDKWNKDNYNI